MPADPHPQREAAKHLGLALKRRRKALGLSLETVGERTGLRWKEISNLEDGEPAIPLGDLLAIAEALGMRVSIDAD